MKRFIVGWVVLAAAGTGALAMPSSATAVPSTQRVEARGGDTLLRTSCTVWSRDGYEFQGCAGLVKNSDGKIVATGTAIGDTGTWTLKVRVTHVRLFVRSCDEGGWRVLRSRPSKDGWHAAEFDRTRGTSKRAVGRWFAGSAFVAYKDPDTGYIRSQQMTTRSYGTCPS